MFLVLFSYTHSSPWCIETDRQKEREREREREREIKEKEKENKENNRSLCNVRRTHFHEARHNRLACLFVKRPNQKDFYFDKATK